MKTRLQSFARRLRKLRRSLRDQLKPIKAELERLRRARQLDYRKMTAADFARKVLGVKPFPYQTRLLEDNHKRLVAVMGRQSGKTTTIG